MKKTENPKNLQENAMDLETAPPPMKNRRNISAPVR